MHPRLLVGETMIEVIAINNIIATRQMKINNEATTNIIDLSKDFPSILLISL